MTCPNHQPLGKLPTRAEAGAYEEPDLDALPGRVERRFIFGAQDHPELYYGIGNPFLDEVDDEDEVAGEEDDGTKSEGK